MRLVLLLIAALIALPAAAMAQHGTIGLYTEETATNCDMVDAGQGILTVYVVHTQVAGSTASEFMVQPSTGFTATHVGDYTPYLYIGNSQTGISVGYGECLSGPISIMTITYLFDGTSSACGYLEVVGDPGAVEPPGLYTVDCAPYWERQKHVPQGGKLFVNGDGSCPCLSPVPVREGTWGQIKVLYR